MSNVEPRWWQLPFARLSTELTEQAAIASASARIARDNLRDSCRNCADLRDVARDILARLS